MDTYGTDLFALREEAHLTSSGSRKELVPVADAEKGCACIQQRHYPFFQFDAPWKVVRYHRMRSRYHRARTFLRCRERSSIFSIHNSRLNIHYPKRRCRPLVKVAELFRYGGKRGSSLNNIQPLHLTPWQSYFSLVGVKRQRNTDQVQKIVNLYFIVQPSLFYYPMGKL